MNKFRFYNTVLILLLFAFNISTFSQNSDSKSFLDSLYNNEIEQYFGFDLRQAQGLEYFGKFISIDKVDNNGRVFAYANREGFSKFLETGLSFDLLPHPGDFSGYLNMKEKVDIREISEWDFYPTYDAYIDMMNQFADQYPSICQLVTIGTTIQGRQILAVKISDNVGLSENEPQFLYTSSIHGDETTGYILMLRLADYLLSNYNIDPRLTNLVNEIEIWINPLANPDGTYFGGNNTVNGARRYNYNGIDLNRNFPDPEDGPHPDGYPWQTETVHFMNLAQNNHFVSSANIHGGEEVCNYPWDTWSRLAADDSWWQYVCHEYADTAQLHSPAGYMSDFDDGITNGYQWYTISGGRQDYMNYFHQAREFTLEISDQKLLSPGLLPAWWEYNYRSLLNYLEQSMFGLRGTVRDSVTGWPIRAEVYAVLHELDSSWVYSSLPAGNYHRLLHEGTYTIRYSAPGYETKVIQNVEIVNRQATILDVKLVPEGVGGINNPSVSNRIDIYPVPVTNGYLNFKTDLNIRSVFIYDTSGKLLKQITEPINEGFLDIHSLENGIYIAGFFTNQGFGFKKIAVMR